MTKIGEVGLGKEVSKIKKPVLIYLLDIEKLY